MPRERGSSGFTLAELARETGAELRGNGDLIITAVGTLEEAGPEQITFLNNPRYRKHLGGCRAGAVILRPEDLESCATNALVTDNPYLVWARVLRFFAPAAEVVPGIHAAAVVAEGAEVADSATVAAGAVIAEEAIVADGAFIGPNCVIGRGAMIGEGSRLVALVTVLDGVRIGRHCILHPGVTVGSDGFGLARDGRRWEKVPQLGSVVIEDEVEISANTTVDRGAVHDTVIRQI
ncbi:MAG TPA: UDP-3-O-(3-hydroxymyristoyl)glucosamine N-acyltransferase, partial [Chromatiaceae bacterium]|nr:UDP-3-O-(3-hydroxymyristoyl)glucosamine N-acyltransferase [Chromatiaceae bacterium]